MTWKLPFERNKKWLCHWVATLGVVSVVAFEMDRLLCISRLILFWAGTVWGCLREARACVWNIYTNTTQTGRLWQHLLRCGPGRKNEKALSLAIYIRYKKNNMQFSRIVFILHNPPIYRERFSVHILKQNMSIHAHWIYSHHYNMRPNADQTGLCRN